VREIKSIIVHCSLSSFGDAALIRSWHLAPPHGFLDIGYHYVVLNGVRKARGKYDPKCDGRIEKGRGLDYRGAHCPGDNVNGIGICLVGNSKFTASQISRLVRLIRAIRARFGSIPVYGHYERPSGIKQGKTCPNIDMVKFRKEYKL